VGAQQLLDLIGNTPLVEITRIDAGACRLFLKLESQNPGGSIKDRIGRSMIGAAERDGKLKPGGTLIEATAGNTGLGVALVATLKGYKLILAGSSSGTLLTAALRYCREQKTPKRVVSFVCDSGNKYLSKVFNDYWMIDQGFIKRERDGDLRDLITRRHDEQATVTIGPDDKLMAAYARMKLYDISQIPVLESGKVIGIVDEWDLLTATRESPGASSTRCDGDDAAP